MHIKQIMFFTSAWKGISGSPASITYESVSNKGRRRHPAMLKTFCIMMLIKGHYPIGRYLMFDLCFAEYMHVNV
jgi:hypothetical protein